MLKVSAKPCPTDRAILKKLSFVPPDRVVITVSQNWSL